MSTSARPDQAQVPEEQILESKLNTGMITQIDPRDIPTSAVQLALNANCRFDKLSRRAGSSLLAPTKPNNQPVTRIAFIKTADGSPYTVRMTPSTIHVRNAGSWSGISIPTPLIGGISDRFDTADILNKFVFTNNGKNPIQVVDFVAGTCTPLGNAASVYGANPRFVIGFFNRVLAFALKDTSEVTAIWSADGVPTQFDPSVDQTAGSSPILESPADLSDFITGAVAFTNVAVMAREKSMWLITKQAIPTDPYYFFSTLPGIGCDCSYSIQLVGNGVVWVDTKKEAVYAYVPGGPETKLSDAIKNSLFKDITDPTQVFSAYNGIPGEYNIYIPIGGNVTRNYTYNFDNKSWTLQELYGVTGADNVEIATAGTTIDQLLGNIDSLPGTIDSLSDTGSIAQPFSYGRNDGTIITENVNVDIDGAHTDFPNGVIFETQIVSKLHSFPTINLLISKINLSYQATRTCVLVVEYSRDNGLTWKMGKTLTTTVFNKPVNFSFRKLIKAKMLTWRVRCTASDIEFLGYEVYAYPFGDTRTDE